MKNRYPLAGIDHRTTPALSARLHFLRASAVIVAVSLLLVLALVLATRP